ncbi:uncharacterized protein DNG_00336 [Cephalotrichum gorgonifer]|uniref:DUF1750 domain-containing protein n=1 Tax=Cephalotrichum gorgonifer TaxID=2041049 RepID=A0AAE8MP77_9PEZI|nr:uncharacterized protein DNG_00336 [Cephalotrichum gorgonifer]
MANMPQDPSSGIHPELLPHVHLLSAHGYALMPRVDVQNVVKWLSDAPRVAKNQSPFHWTYLDGPVDGTILLTWQPLARLGTNFSSDGFVWAGPEQLFKQDLGNGLALEIYLQKAGFLPGEPETLHARRRFRLIPAQGNNPHGPQPDLSLWIVHYGPSEPSERIPVNMIPVDQRVHHLMNTRNYLKRCGQIHRKDFMLSDRVNWPQIAFPKDGGRQQMYASPTNARGVPQQMAYPPQTPTGPPTKRARHASASQSHPAPPPAQVMPPMEAVYDDDEDTSRGDMFDQVTPRELALSRYQQNHEWMEEILSSAYKIDQITPANLGLGFKGELASLTEGIFPAQGGEAALEAIASPYATNLEPKLAAEFRNRISAYMDSSKAEIEAIKADHAKSLAQMKASTKISVAAEKELRDIDPHFGTAPSRGSEGDAGSEDEEVSPKPQKPTKSLEDIVSEVERKLNRRTHTLRSVVRIQDGGYQQPAPVPEPTPQVPSVSVPAGGPSTTAPTSQQPSTATSQHEAMGMDDPDLEMGGTAGELLSQMQPGLSSTSTPAPHTASALPSAVATPGEVGVPSPAPQPAAPEQKPEEGGAAVDTPMGNAEAPQQSAAQAAPDQGAVSGDWVMVPKGGESPDAASANIPSNSGAASEAKETQPSVPPPAAAPVAKQVSSANTPADGGSNSFDNDFSSLDDLDTAGDALASYEAPGGGDLGDGLDLNMDMDDSAFGDAFHGGSNSGTPADNNGGHL